LTQYETGVMNILNFTIVILIIDTVYALDRH